jgi:hypothetical protein
MGKGVNYRYIFNRKFSIPYRFQKRTGLYEKIVLCLLISSREGEILLVDLASLIDVGMQVNLRCLDRGMTKVFLHDPEIL